MEGLGDEENERTRTGTLWTATAHIMATVIGSGVLALPWSVAQMGWIIGPLAIIVLALVTYYTAILLSDCYRFPDPINGRRNHSYMGVVRACLGKRGVLICGIVQYAILWGTIVGYTITAATSMMTVKRSSCFREKGHGAKCGTSGNLFMLLFGGIEIILSQFPSLEKVAWLSVMATTMSIGYSFIVLCLCMVRFASHRNFKGSLTGVKIGLDGISPSTKVWHSSQALGNIAFACTYAMLLFEIQDTLRSPPSENKTMKKASVYVLVVTTLFYLSLGCVGYMAFGNEVRGNVLTDFHEPFWLVGITNLAVLIHLVGAYQVYAQPIFTFYENWLASRWPSTGFFHNVYTLHLPCTKESYFQFTFCRLLLRTIFVIFTTAVSMMFPFFNAILGLIGALAFWPLTVYFPVSMYMIQEKIKKGSGKWVLLQSLSTLCLLVSLFCAIGSVAGIVQRLKHARLFNVTL